MKNLLFILTVLLCTVSCSKEESATPTQPILSFPELLVSCEWQTGGEIVKFYKNNTFTRTGPTRFLSGTYAATNTTLNQRYSTGGEFYLSNIIVSNDTIYGDLLQSKKHMYLVKL